VVQSPTAAEYARGALYGFAAVTIWAGFIVVARLGIRTSMTPWDIAAIRFTVSGSLLLPCVIREGLALEPASSRLPCPISPFKRSYRAS